MQEKRSLSIRFILLALITLVVVIRVSSSLLASWNEPQITNRLQLYQTDLLLNAAELQQPSTATGAPPMGSVLIGAAPLETALKQYREVRSAAETSLQAFQTRLENLNPVSPAPSTVNETSPPDSTGAIAQQDTNAELRQSLQAAVRKQQDLMNQLDVRIGILEATQANVGEAVSTWQEVIARSPDAETTATTALTLLGLWDTPPRILPDTEPALQQSLDGWFRYQALVRLYTLQQRADVLAQVKSEQQAIAQKTLVKLAVVSLLPVFGAIAGLGLLIVVLVQWVIKGPQAVLAQNRTRPWDTPWSWETIWQVLIVGFFFSGQLLVPLLIGILGLGLASMGSAGRALYTLIYYLSMSAVGLLVLYFSLRPYFPLPKEWFQVRWGDRWPLWGAGGYLVALPLMIAVSLLNQALWQGQGGNNPLLEVVLEEGNPFSLGIFFFTASVAAPLFEEILFRGFLLSSLTRHLPVGGAIALSGVIFAIAHLSLSEVLPLSVLGCVLGVVYTRSRNLLAPMLLHSLWNGATLLSLFVLGSG